MDSRELLAAQYANRQPREFERVAYCDYCAGDGHTRETCEVRFTDIAERQ